MKRTTSYLSFLFMMMSMLSYADLPPTTTQDVGMVREDHKASKLLDMNVRNLEDQKVGEIEDLVIDFKSGRVVYAVLSVGGFLGMGEKLFAVPPAAFKFSNDYLVLDVNKEKLEKAPGFNKDAWPEKVDRKWTEDVYKYYGQTYNE